MDSGRTLVVPFNAEPKSKKQLKINVPLQAFLLFILWCGITINSALDPIKTLWGYYWHADCSKHSNVWQLSTASTFNNQSSKECNASGPFLDCYFELPVYGSGSLDGSICRSYYPTDLTPTQHITCFFGNCTLPSGQQIFLPDSTGFATSLWSMQASSEQRDCLSWIGEGDPFPCDSFTTFSGEVINYRKSRSETSKWCKEFGAYYVLNISASRQEVLVANVSIPNQPSFATIALDYKTPIMTMELGGCLLSIHVGGIPAHVTTVAWYGDTIAPWTARTTSSAKLNTLTSIGKKIHVQTEIYLEGDMTQIRSLMKDICRCAIMFSVIYYRIFSIYYPIWLVFQRQHKPLWKWAIRNYMGLVIHKRERNNLFILFLLSFEAFMSVEDIVMYCQHTVYTIPTTSFVSLIMDYMSISRIIWPCAFLLLGFSRVLQFSFGPNYALLLSEDLFLLGAPVVWLYIPSYVTTQGMALMQGYRWTGKYIYHFTSTVANVYAKQYAVVDLYLKLFGYFTILSCIVTLLLGILWQRLTHTKSITGCIFGNQRITCRSTLTLHTNSPLENVLLESTDHFPPAIVYQITKAKKPGTDLCLALYLAAEGLVCIAYGKRNILALLKWGVPYPVRNKYGHIACIEDHTVKYDPTITPDTLTKISARPVLHGVPDLY